MTTPNRRKSVRSEQPTKNRRSAVAFALGKGYVSSPPSLTGSSGIDWSAGDWDFTCPVCGSSYFNTDLFKQMGHCKGQPIDPSRRNRGYRGCTFSWPRSEDAKYFKLGKVAPTHKRFRLSNARGEGSVFVLMEIPADVASASIAATILAEWIRYGFRATEVE